MQHHILGNVQDLCVEIPGPLWACQAAWSLALRGPSKSKLPCASMPLRRCFAEIIAQSAVHCVTSIGQRVPTNTILLNTDLAESICVWKQNWIRALYGYMDWPHLFSMHGKIRAPPLCYAFYRGFLVAHTGVLGCSGKLIPRVRSGMGKDQSSLVEHLASPIGLPDQSLPKKVSSRITL